MKNHKMVTNIDTANYNAAYEQKGSSTLGEKYVIYR